MSVRLPLVGVVSVSKPLYCASKPGLGPAADLLFFESQKKRRQKKGDPGARDPSLRYGQPALLAQRGKAANSLRSDMRPSGVTPLCCAARRGHRGGAGRRQRQRQSPSGHAVACPDGVGCWFSLCWSSQCRVAGPSSAGARGSGLALSEPQASLARPPLARAAQGTACRRPGQSARLSFAYFSLAKQRTSEAAAGAQPGLLKQYKI